MGSDLVRVILPGGGGERNSRAGVAADTVKIILALFQLEVHDRGLHAISRILRDAGHEVIILGNAAPDQIAAVARDEAADIIGISTYCGGAVDQGGLLAGKVPGYIRLMIGGLLTSEQQDSLGFLGFKCFPSGTPTRYITAWIDKLPAR